MLAWIRNCSPGVNRLRVAEYGEKNEDAGGAAGLYSMKLTRSAVDFTWSQRMMVIAQGSAR